MAPGVVGPIQDLISELNISEMAANELFISTNKKMKPVKDMPIHEDKAWDKLIKEINIKKANTQKIKNFNAEDIDAVIKEIRDVAKTKNNDTLNSIVYKFRDQYKTKKLILPNVDKIKKVLEELLYSSEETNHLGGISYVILHKER